jgi:phage protein D
MVTPGMTQQTPEVGVHVSISARSGSTEDRASQAQSVADEHGMQGGIALELEAFGLPEMFPAEVIEVSGLGRKFSGLYGVTHLKHKADGDGWLMTMDVLRNAFSLNEVQAARVEGRVNVGGDSSETSGSDVSGTTAGASDVVVQPVVGE